MPSPSVAVIVVAAGSGLRLDAGMPKAFVSVAGRTILERCLDEVFVAAPRAQVIVVVPHEFLELAKTMLSGSPLPTVDIIEGGPTRQVSVGRGLTALGEGVTIVLVHDAARAFAPASLFEAVIGEVNRTGHGVIPGVPVVGTVKRIDERGGVIGQLDRSSLREIQTPQGFPRAAFVEAHDGASEEFTDDAGLFSASGHAVSVIDGNPLAFKITTPWDLRRAEQLAAASGAVAEVVASRTGIGMDVHGFDDSRSLWLGGLHWPDEPGLAGHSDGDAVCHAMCDALLSAAGLGDMGSRFGTHDERFLDARGQVFVAETVRLVAGAGFRIVNVAVQVIANHPKIGSRRAEVEAALQAMVGAPVSVGATTTDGLGFTGTGAGLAAIATCLLARQ